MEAPNFRKYFEEYNAPLFNRRLVRLKDKYTFTRQIYDKNKQQFLFIYNK